MDSQAQDGIGLPPFNAPNEGKQLAKLAKSVIENMGLPLSHIPAAAAVVLQLSSSISDSQLSLFMAQ